MTSDLTVCVTSFKRSKYLDRCLHSLVAAGIKRIVVFSQCPDFSVEKVVHKHSRHPGIELTYRKVGEDNGCNFSWMMAAYYSKTDRVIIMHDDDTLLPQFGKVYAEKIKPVLDSGGAGFATWRACLLYDDGSTKPTDFRHANTGVYSSDELNDTVNHYGRLSVSPIISVLDRATIIRAAKESEQFLTPNECLHRPYMLLGTEIIVYLRHIQKYPKWLWVDEVLSHYGSHQGSGTIAAEKNGDLSPLTKGYDVARRHFEEWKEKTIPYKPRVIFGYADTLPLDQDEVRRWENARYTWDYHFNQGDMIELPIELDELPRSSDSVGDMRPVPYLNDILDHVQKFAMPEDVMAYCNRDIGLTSMAPERIIAGVERGNGVTVCQRRNLTPEFGRMYKTVRNCKTDGGFDVWAMTPQWWERSKAKMPLMFIGREAVDTVFRTIAEEWADRRDLISDLRNDWHNSRAYTDDVAWHECHFSFWQTHKTTNPSQKMNRDAARHFFQARNNKALLRLLSDTKSEVVPKPAILTRRPVVRSGFRR